jgi:hypothetical protein
MERVNEILLNIGLGGVRNETFYKMSPTCHNRLVLSTTISFLSTETSSASTSSARMVVLLQRVVVFVVVARWSKDIFIICITFWALCTMMDDYQQIGGLFGKKEWSSFEYISKFQFMIQRFKIFVQFELPVEIGRHYISLMRAFSVFYTITQLLLPLCENLP